MGRLDGKVAIVTGAARGTGEAIARLLVEEGAKVLLGDILDDRGKPVADSLGDAARYLHLDIANEHDWEDAVELTLREFGSLTTLVNNAAILHVAPIAETSADEYMRVVRVNELGTFLGVRSAIEPMKAAGGGSIINIGSIDAWHAAPGTVAYAASKFAVRGITKVAALELGRFGIRVNAINPAAGNPEMVQPFLPEGLDLKKLSRGRRAFGTTPIGRRGEMIDVARAVVFLASDESSFFSGADFPLDGGVTAGMIIPGDIPGTGRSRRG